MMPLRRRVSGGPCAHREAVTHRFQGTLFSAELP